jgi:hypothetical protein
MEMIPVIPEDVYESRVRENPDNPFGIDRIPMILVTDHTDRILFKKRDIVEVNRPAYFSIRSVTGKREERRLQSFMVNGPGIELPLMKKVIVKFLQASNSPIRNLTVPGI